jgi:hypothetical protein
VQDALTKAGGRNYKGEPNFRFAWSAQETYLISNGREYEPFRICAEDCWLLMKWEPAEFWGTREEWEQTNWEPGKFIGVPGGIGQYEPLFTAGPYPSEGRYRAVRSLKKSVIKEGVMTFEHPEPTLAFVDQIFPLIRDFLELDTEKKAELLATRELNEKSALAKKFAASREDYRGIATARQVEKQTEKIERFLKDPKRVKQALQLTKRSTK